MVYVEGNFVNIKDHTEMLCGDVVTVTVSYLQVSVKAVRVCYVAVESRTEL